MQRAKIKDCNAIAIALMIPPAIVATHQIIQHIKPKKWMIILIFFFFFFFKFPKTLHGSN